MKVRLSTTVDEGLLAAARKAGNHPTDAALLEAAFTAYLASHRSAEIDQACARAYAEQPLDTEDEWGDLDTWHRTVAGR